MSSSSFLPIEADFATLLKEKFKSATESGSLKFTQSTEADEVEDEVFTFQVRIAPSLGQKSSLQQQQQPSVLSPKFDPFENPEPALFLTEIGTNHSLVLNKFSIVPYHFLAITKKFESQSSPLSEHDLTVTWSLLQAKLKGQANSRLLAFYNCGSLSGASQDHKHIQFIPVSKDIQLIPDFVLEDFEAPRSRDALGIAPISHPGLPFAHFILPVPKNPTIDDLILRFSALFSRTLTVLREHDQSNKSYNFAMTSKWMFMAPRSKEEFEGVSVNSTGLVGLLLAKSQYQAELIKTVTPLHILGSVGLPVLDKTEQQHDY
ncbi:ATP adenylyltransferase-domain-containing protein [Lipomyces japonicus]|uniref:ATP adenylyltransferase-domain-containing protein n=1 Tax=Lipomyces japonicus TaxID=56871 RepID=UPI0034CE69B6